MPDNPMETLLILPAADELLADRLAEGDAPVLRTPVLYPIDLTRTHGTDITRERIAELAASYNPDIETATLNFDHTWGGPSLGRCERVWVEEDQLWVSYVDLAPEVVEGVRSGRYTRRSAELVTNHVVTSGWYLTGLALLGQARPAVPALPPVRLRGRYVVITGAEPAPKEKPMSDPGSQEPPPATTTLSSQQAEELRGGLALVAELRTENARLRADKAIETLGSRVSPAMRRVLQPLLVHLMANPAPDSVKLSAQGGKEETLTVADAILRVLNDVPGFEALNMPAAAGDADPAAQDAALSADHAALYSRYKLSPERLAELRSRYQEGN